MHGRRPLAPDPDAASVALHRHSDVAARHSARHRQRWNPRLLSRVPKTLGSSAKSAVFPRDFEASNGSKDRRLRPCKISIEEVLISVRLSVRGEVAERLKAAVC